MNDRPLSERVRDMTWWADPHYMQDEEMDDLADEIAKLEAKTERLEWMLAEAENLDPYLIEGLNRSWSASLLEGREP